MTLKAQDLWNDVMAVRAMAPLVHSITNLVAMSYNANVLLALGASPVMAHAKEEVEEMSSIANALVLNIGTLEPKWIESMKLAAKIATSRGIPVVLDPVGAGATHYRNKTIEELLFIAKPNIMRGNASEIMSSAGIMAQTKGVDSTQASDTALIAANQLAQSINGIVCISGETDHILDPEGQRISFSNGHIWMTKITGVGCSATAMIGAFAAIQPNYWRATASAMAYLGVVGESAVEYIKKKNLGIGSLQITLLDKLQLLTKEEFMIRLKISTHS